MRYSDTLWTLFSAVGTRILMILATMAAARLIGREEFGKIAIYQTTLLFALTYANVGAANIGARYVPEYKAKNPDRLGDIYAVVHHTCVYSGLILALIVAATAKLVATHVFGAPEYSDFIIITAPAIFFSSIFAAHTSILSGLGRFKTLAKVNTLSTFLIASFIPLGAYLQGARGAAVGMMVSTIFQVVISHYALGDDGPKQSFHPVLVADNLKRHSHHILQGLYTTVSSLFVSGANWYTTGSLTKLHGTSELAIFNVANQWKTAILFIPAAMGPLIINKFATDQSAGRSGKKALARILAASFALGVVAFAAISVISGDILSGYGHSFIADRSAFLLILFSAVIITINNVISKYMIATAPPSAAAKADTVWAVAYLAIYFAIFTRDGAMGLGYAAIAASLLQLVYQFYVVRAISNDGDATTLLP